MKTQRPSASPEKPTAFSSKSRKEIRSALESTYPHLNEIEEAQVLYDEAEYLMLSAENLVQSALAKKLSNPKGAFKMAKKYISKAKASLTPALTGIEKLIPSMATQKEQKMSHELYNEALQLRQKLEEKESEYANRTQFTNR